MAAPLIGYLTNYLAERLDISPHTAAYYRAAVSGLEQWAGRPIDLADLSKPFLLAWLSSLADRAPSTVNTRRGAILTLWRSAADAGLCPSPPPRIPKRRTPRRDPVAWTLDELRRLYATAGDLPGAWGDCPIAGAWRLAIAVTWETGCRLDELLLARPADLDAANACWTVPAEHTKGRAADHIYHLTADTIALAAALPAGRDRLFPFPWGRRQLWVHFGHLLRAAGLPDDRQHKWHCLRRTASTYAALARGDEWAARAIGHTLSVARQSYISRRIAPAIRLADALPSLAATPADAPPILRIS
jgi:integrase